VAASGNPEKFETYIPSIGIWFSISVYSYEKGTFIAVFDTITERKQTEEKLQEHVKMLDLAHVLVRDPDYKIIFWNRGAEELYGWSKEEALGKFTYQLFQTIYPHSQNEVNETLSRYGVWEGELIHTKRDGSRLFVASHQVLQRDQDNRPLAVIEVNNDVTALKQAEEALQEHARLLDLAHVMVRDLDSKIIFWNSGVEELYGWSKEEALGKLTHQLLQTVFPHSKKEVDDELLKCGVWEGELIHTRRDGSQLFVASHQVLHRDKDDRPLAIIEINNDVTALKRAEEALQKAHAELEQRVQERTKELSDLYNYAPCGYHSLNSDGLIVRIN